MRKGFAIVMASILVSLCAPRAIAAPETSACLSSYEQTQRLRQSGKLVDAAARAVACAAESCPAALRSECATWLDEIRRATPSVVVVAKDGDACDVVDARVTIDGTHRATRLDGRPLALDPGEHTIRVEAPSGAPLEQRVVLAQGDQSRQVALGTAPAGAVCGQRARETVTLAPARVPSRKPPTAAWVLGGIGAAALVTGVVVEVAGLSLRSTLDDCKPGCDPSRVDGMRTTFLVGDLLLGAGIVAGAVAAYLWLSSKPPEPKAASRSFTVRF